VSKKTNDHELRNYLKSAQRGMKRAVSKRDSANFTKRRRSQEGAKDRSSKNKTANVEGRKQNLRWIEKGPCPGPPPQGKRLREGNGPLFSRIHQQKKRHRKEGAN